MNFLSHIFGEHPTPESEEILHWLENQLHFIQSQLDNPMYELGYVTALTDTINYLKEKK